MRAPLLVLAVGVIGFVGCPKKRVETAPSGPPLGWHEVQGVQCFNPPAFAEETNEIVRKDMRAEVWSELYRGLSGGLIGAPAMQTAELENLELMLLGYPDRIETFSREAHERCTAAAQSGDISGYVAWLSGARAELSAGDCNRGLVFEVHDSLDVSEGWQQRYHMCKGDTVLIGVPAGDRLFTVQDTGTPGDNVYIGMLGVPGELGTADSPCPTCRRGELIVRFEPDSGGQSVQPFFPIPADADIAAVYAEYAEAEKRLGVQFEAPEHGFISFGFNDTTVYDNAWYEHPEGYSESAQLDIYPVVGE